MNYKTFYALVEERLPGVPIRDRYTGLTLRRVYKDAPNKEGLDENAWRGYAQICADLILAGRNSVNRRSMEVMRGLAGRLVQSDTALAELETQPAIPATRNPARPPVVA